MLDSSTRRLGISLGRAHPKVDNLTCACMQPLACQLVRLNLHANGDPKFCMQSRRVTCQLSSGDGGPSTRTWTAASCRLPAWCCTPCRHAHAASSSHSMRVRAIHATQVCKCRMLTTYVHVVPMHSCVLLHARCCVVFLASTALLARAPHSTHGMQKHEHKRMHVARAQAHACTCRIVEHATAMIRVHPLSIAP